MSHLTISDLVKTLHDPVFSGLQQDANGRFYAYVETGPYKPYHASVVPAARRRGIEVVRKCDGVFYAYVPVHRDRPMQTVLAQANDPAARPAPELGASVFVRETRPEQERLSAMASWLFERVPAGHSVQLLGPHGEFAGAYVHRPMNLIETEVGYWNDFGRSLPDATLTKVGDDLWPPKDFRSLAAKEAAEALAMAERVEREMPATPARYNW